MTTDNGPHDAGSTPPDTFEAYMTRLFSWVSTAQRNGCSVSDSIRAGATPLIESTLRQRDEIARLRARVAELEGVVEAVHGVIDEFSEDDDDGEGEYITDPTAERIYFAMRAALARESGRRGIHNERSPMTTTLDLFTKPFPNPAGGEWPPLVERVAIRPIVSDRCPMEAYEALLIVAAHRWAAGEDQVNAIAATPGLPAWVELQEYAATAEPEHLVLACHLIADAIQSASASSSSSSSSSSSGGSVSGN